MSEYNRLFWNKAEWCWDDWERAVRVEMLKSFELMFRESKKAVSNE